MEHRLRWATRDGSRIELRRLRTEAMSNQLLAPADFEILHIVSDSIPLETMSISSAHLLQLKGVVGKSRKSKDGQSESNSNSKNQDLDHDLPVLLPVLLRQMLKDDKSVVRTDDEFLTPFLRVREYDVQRVAISVKSFYSNMERNADLLQNIRPSQFVDYYETYGAVVGLHGRAKNGSTVGLCSARNWDFNKYPLRPFQQSIALQMFMLLLTDKETQLNGLSVIFDLEGLTLSHLAQLTVKEIKRLAICAQGGTPVKWSSIHMINHPSIFWGLYYIARKFIKAKLWKRIYFHRSQESLYEHFDLEMLPTTLGGPLEMKDAIHKPWYEKMLAEDKYAAEYYL